MNSEYLDTIWSQFGIEADEHLDLIESLLIEAENGSLNQDGIAQMFRSFHSLKGLAKALDLISISMLSHKAEDILGLARSGKLQLDSDWAALLFKAFDQLKKLLAHALETRQDDSLPKELSLQLEEAFKKAHSETIQSSETTEPETKHEPLPAEYPTRGNEAQKIDPDLLIFYAELLSGNIPHLEFILAPEDSHNEMEVVKKAFESVEQIHHATQVIGLNEIAKIIEGLYASLTHRYTEPEKIKDQDDKKALTQTLKNDFLQLLNALQELQDNHKPGFGKELQDLLKLHVRQKEAVSAPQPATNSEETQSEDSSNQERRDPSENQTERRSNRSREQRADLVRIQGKTLDNFLNRIGEMVSIRGTLNYAIHDENCRGQLQYLLSMAQEIREQEARGITPEKLQPDLIVNIIELIRDQIDRISQADLQLQNTLLNLQKGVMELRIIPINTVLQRLPRVVRDLAQEQQKDIQLEMTGQDVRIDKSMVDILIEPLIHMVRNSIDHGIESAEDREKKGKAKQANISIAATQRGNHIELVVADDGQGLNPEVILQKAIKNGLIQEADASVLGEHEIFQLIFQPGFSTKASITETSGRGVGLDVVQTSVTRLGGNVSVHSTMNEGTQFTLYLPFSVAIQDTLLVKVENQVLAIPDRFVFEVMEIQADQLHSIKGQKVVDIRGDFMPIIALKDLLGIKAQPQKAASADRQQKTEQTIVLLSNGRHRIGLKVDGLSGRRELFVKEIHPKLAALPGVGGASTLGDGSAVLILDGEDLFLLASSYFEEKDYKEVA